MHISGCDLMMEGTFLPLPEKYFYVKQMQSRKIGYDSYVRINGNKYSIPVQYADKRYSLGWSMGSLRIVIYYSDGMFILSREAFDGKQQIRRDAEHYEAIALKTATSIPRIRRGFIAKFSSGAHYPAAAGRKFDQPTHHAGKIMKLGELYDDSILDMFIGTAMDKRKMNIRSFRAAEKRLQLL